MPRLLTYNVHRCVGTDGHLDVGRVAAVIAALAPDVVALQELDVGRARTGHVHQAETLARRLGMSFHFHAALHVEAERYGDAILTALPVRLIKAGPLPGHAGLGWLEPRGALWVAVEVDGFELQVINTHLGLVPREQRDQAKALVGPEWLGAPGRRDPAMLVGDFNAIPLALAYRTLNAALTEARRRSPGDGRVPTFPSRAPILAIDHVFVSPGVAVTAVGTPRDPLSRRASDHLPLVVDFQLHRP